MNPATLPCQDPIVVMRAIDVCLELEQMRGRDGVDVYTYGNCGNLFTHLKGVFHCAHAREVIDEDHIVTKIGKNYFDAYGIETLPHTICEKSVPEKVIKHRSNNYEAIKFLEHKTNISKEAYNAWAQTHASVVEYLEAQEARLMDGTRRHLARNLDKIFENS